MPPLRERKTDILVLAEHFIGRAESKQGKRIQRISSYAIDPMMHYHWPGNIRELENCMERAVLLTTNGVIYGHHLPLSLQTAEEQSAPSLSRLQTSLAALEQEMIVDALRAAHGNGTRAARALGIREHLIRLRIAKYRIDPKHYRHRSASRQEDRESMPPSHPEKGTSQMNGKFHEAPTAKNCYCNGNGPNMRAGTANKAGYF